MAGFYIPPDTRQQRLYITAKAMSVIKSDIDAFCNIPQKKQISSFINTMIVNFYKTANSSISAKQHRLELEYEEMLEGIPDKKAIAKKLSSAMIKRSMDIPKDKPIKTRKNGLSIILSFNRDIKNILEISPENEYYNSYKEYIEALISEYTELPYADRERIYFGTLVSTLEAAIQRKEEICFYTREFFQKVRPIKIKTDGNNTFNYLIGFVFENDEWKPRSYRIQRIEKLHTTDILFSVSKADMNKIDKMLSQVDVPYISASFSSKTSDDYVIVRLSDVGYRLYKTVILFQRPSYSEEIQNSPNDHRLKFFCTENQAYNYFIKFGRDVEILYPQSLRMKFKKMHSIALSYYSEE